MGSILSRRIAGVEDIDIQANSAYRFPPKYKDEADCPTEEDGGKPKVLYGVEFTFDADARVAITLYCQAFEEFSNGMAVYNPKSPLLVSETVHYKRGVSQHFSMPSFKIDFSDWKEEDLNFDLDRGAFPMVVQAVVDEGDDCLGHAHVLLTAFERHVDGSFSVKPLKQKQIVDRVSYLLQEIYGIENKNNQETKPSDDENSDNSNECVVCLSDLRDTLILPCRHLSFRALLQIRAVRKKPGALSPVSFSPVLAQTMDHEEHSSSDPVPPGFEPISLLEALNGLRSISPSIPSAPLYDDINFSGNGESRPLSSPEHLSDTSSQQKIKVSKSPDSTLRSPSSPIQEEDEEKLSEMSDAQPNTLLSSSPAPTEVTGAEDVAESLSPDDEEDEEDEERPRSREEEILQDCSSEHSSLIKTGSDQPGDLSLPGSSTESLKSGGTNSSRQPLLPSPRSNFHHSP
ncbi:hypothetical protein CRUP_016147 [Coryphaenoides rupestris]|nr:hypothetical protein CRUP_016147 [Coryphaenoides rupestris]